MLSPALGALALLALPFVVGDFWSYQLALSFLYAIAALGVGLCWGRTGFLPLGQALFFGLGAYLSGLVLINVEHPAGLIALLPLAVVIPGLLAFAIGVLVFRRRGESGPYFTMITLALSLLAAAAHAQSPSVSDWGHYGGDSFAQRYSPLRQINRDNVARLEVAWTYRTGERGEGFARAGKLAFEATPVLAFGRLYLSTPTNIVIALDPATGKVSTLRGKEEAHDYRYFPEPDLVPVELDAAYVERVRASLPELPAARKERYMRELGLPAYDAGVLSTNRGLSQYFERVAALVGDAELSANWVMGDFSAYLNAAGLQAKDAAVSPEALAELLGLIADGTLSSKMAKDVFTLMVETGKPAETVVAEQGMGQISDTAALEGMIAELVAANPGPAEEFRQGREKVLGFFVGQIMKQTKGQANPQLLNELLRKALQ